MKPGPMTQDDFDALCRRGGLTLSAERRARLWAVRDIVDTIVDRLWTDDLPGEAEPAHVFRAEPARIETPT